MKLPNSNDFTFSKETNLFGEEVLMILRNKDKKHIISIRKNHLDIMKSLGYDPNDHDQIISYLHNEYIDILK